MVDAGVGGAPKWTGGGGGGSSKPYGGSKKSSGQSRSSEPTLKQTGFYGDLIDDIEKAGGEPPLSIKKFKKLGFEEASTAIDEAIEARDNLKE